MRAFKVVLLSVALSTASSKAADNPPVIPASWPADRYDKLIQQSPFAPATPVKAPAEPDWATNLYLSSVAAVGDSYLVGIASRENPNSKIFLTSGEPGPENMTLERVDYSAERGKSKAIVRKGDKTATLEFDQMALQNTIASVAAPQPPQGGFNPGAAAARRPVVLPRTNPTGQPITGVTARPNVPQPAGVVPPTPGYQPPLAAGPKPTTVPDTRRRVRIINRAPAE